MTDRPLTPESEALHQSHWHNGRDYGCIGSTCTFRRELEAIEAAAIARDREGLVEMVAERLYVYVIDHSAARGWSQWDEMPDHVIESWREDARRILALDAPEALCAWCGVERNVTQHAPGHDHEPESSGRHRFRDAPEAQS